VFYVPAERQHSIGYMGDGVYRSKDSTNSIKVLKEKGTDTKENTNNANNKIHTKIRNSTRYKDTHNTQQVP